jgi:hypothetical protein
MQKGPRKRHLAAEVCTTTGQPTRERFRLLLGSPSYAIDSFKQNSCHFRVSNLPDVAAGGGSGSSSGVQSTSQDIPSLDLLWVESKSKKAALKVFHVYIFIL